MFKKIMSISCAVVLMLTLVPANVLAATVINEDVSVSDNVSSNYISSGMETSEEVNAVDSQFTSTASSAALSEDAMEGAYSLKVKIANEDTKDYAQYNLVNTNAFSIASYSRVNLWVKPGAGASWISFYTNGALILSDMDKDGKFEVGADLQSGKWTKVTLDLTCTNPLITTGDDLVVRSDEFSTWCFDGIVSQSAQHTSLDLSTMTDSHITLNNGSLEFKKVSSNSTYETYPSVLTSERDASIKKEFTTQTDFSSGTCENMTINSEGSITCNYPDLSNGGTAISGGDSNPSYAAGCAFDNSKSSFWISSQAGSSLVGNAYIGYDFGIQKSVGGVSITPVSYSSVNSAYVQYYDTATSQWVTVQTINIAAGENAQYFWFDSAISAIKWRLLAKSENSSGYNWAVFNLEFLPLNWRYTSTEINVAATEIVSQGKLTIDALNCSNAIIETQLSLDGGTTWQAWYTVDSDGSISGIGPETNLQNAKLKYRISGTKLAAGGNPTINSIKLLILNNVQSSEPLSGRIKGIKIDSCVADISGNTPGTTDTAVFSALGGCTKFALSGNGSILYYVNSTDGYLYSFDMYTGVSTKLPQLITASSLITNYDGSIVCFQGAYNNTYGIFRFDLNKSSLDKLAEGGSNNFTEYDMQDNGGIVYINRDGNCYLYYCSHTGSSKLITTEYKSNDKYIADVAVANTTGDIYYLVTNMYNTSTLYCAKAVTSYDSPSALLSNVSSIVGVSSDGTKVYVIYNGASCIYSTESGTIQPIESGITFLKKLDKGCFLVKGANYKYYIYDSTTNKKTDITPSDLYVSSPLFMIDAVGEKLIYNYSANAFKIKYLNNSEKVNKHLISFDGKNTWYSYKSGMWNMVSDDKTPDETVLKESGMTAEAINALTKTDFDKLYTDGSEIYSVDVSVYFNSVSYNYTPSIKSIQIITETGEVGGSTVNLLYAAKKTDFIGSKWRYVNRIYPVEVCENASDFMYFFYAKGKYMYYDGSVWHTEIANEISSLIFDVKSNWRNLKLIGMTASELRAIPKSALTAQLAGKDFSVVYCMRVPDKSTKGYLSLINVDYTEDRYESNTLTLNVIYSNGKTEQITGMTSTQIEDFMDWLLVRKKNSPNYFSFKVGSVNYYVNYYMISNVSVTEA